MAGNLPPHGGSLLEATRVANPGGEILRIDSVARADLAMLAVGAYSPLAGFMTSAERAEVAANMRLPSGAVWPIPITLPASAEQAARTNVGTALVLQDEANTELGLVRVREVYQRDPAAEARQVFGTDDAEHPGVALLLQRGPWCVAGEVAVFGPISTQVAGAPCLTPAQTRAAMQARGWQRVVGFQTRNPVHRAHEYIIKCALETCDGLLLHPLVGATKDDDIPAAVRLRCYEALLSSVLPADRVLFSVLPAPMRYAGPREAVLHALVRQNYGCSHFIVGRDHAGVGSYYGTYDAQKIFATLPPQGLAIEPMMFEHSFFCRRCGQMASPKTCPHPGADHIFLSGTKVREMLKRGERPPAEFTRPEVADVLIAWASQT